MTELTLKQTAAIFKNLLEHPAWKLLEQQIKDNIDARRRSTFTVAPGPNTGYDVAYAQGYVAACEQILRIPAGSADSGERLKEAEEKVYGV